MKETLSQSQELKQQQRLTPMQVQFVRMLEMTGPEVEMEVKRQLDEMPGLETVENDHAETTETSESDQFNESAEEIQLADFRTDDDIPSYRFEAKNHSADDTRYEPIAVNDEKSLMEELEEQLNEYDLSSEDRLIASYIIGNIDDNGYIKRSLNSISDDIAIQHSVEVSDAQIRRIFDIIRTLDPPGVGAVDLRDCLLLQLRRRTDNTTNRLAEEIINHYFDLFSKKHFQRITELLGINNESLREAVAVIRQLNPKPGSAVSDTAIEKSARLIVPEFVIEVDGDKLNLSLLNNIPELTVSRQFTDDSQYDTLPQRQRSEAITFARVRRDEAASFIKTLAMRQQTLYNVVAAIVKFQRNFFLTGDETKLRPMILKDVAALTGYDLSIISRATATKYIMTPSGIYPLKFFFNERINPDEDTSFHQIADELKRIIASEDKSSPMSDEEITHRLNKAGFSTARRTVAKYRERLGFPVARLRKEIDQ